MSAREVHLGLYKRGANESYATSVVVPRPLQLDKDDEDREVQQVVDMVNFVLEQNEEHGTRDRVEMQCSTAGVEERVREKLGNKARKVKFHPPKMESIRGQ